MSRSVPRTLYQLLLWLHPPAFKREFAEEMLWIFDESIRDRRAVDTASARGLMRLFADGLVSLGRQWVMRRGSEKLLAGEANLSPSPALARGWFAWEHIAVVPRALPAYRVLQGGAVSIGLLMVLSLLAAQTGSRTLVRGSSVSERGSGQHRAVSGADFGRGSIAPGVVAPERGARDFAGGNDLEEEANGQEGVSRINGSERSGFEAVPQAAEQQGAKTPAAQQFTFWLDAFNSGDRARLQQFLEKNFPARAENVNQALEFRNQTGGFEFKKVEESSATRLAGIVKERDSDQFARFVIEVEPADPHRITRLDLRAIPRPAEFPLPRMSEGEALAALRAELDKNAAAGRFAGSVLVAKNGKQIFTGAYGLADREKKIPNKLDTRFRIGSMNKMFTAAAVLQLAQAGKIQLSDPIGKHLTDYPNKDVASKVTIHHLLTHTGGTGDFFGPEFDAHRLELRTLQDYVKLYGKRGPKFEPGSRWEYSNYGFLLLGVVIEKVTGESYYDYVREHVYQPAGMTSSGSLAEDEAVPERSVGYTKFGGSETWRPNTDTLPYRGTSAGGGYSTVEDLLRFANAIEGHKLLDAHYTELLTTGKVDTPNGEKYAYGFMDRKVGGVRCFGHGGGAPGMNGDLQIYPESGYTIAVLSNMDPPAAQRFADFIGNRLPEK